VSERGDWRKNETRQRQHLVGVRMSPAEMALLKAEAGRSGLTAASVLRQAFLAGVRQEADDGYSEPGITIWYTPPPLSGERLPAPELSDKWPRR
jgi:hypothetical protein